MKTQYISLNMTPSGVNPIFHISQYDVGRLLGFYVYNGSEVVDLDDYTCTVEATRTDGTQITTNVITNNNSGIFAVTATMSNVADKYNCQLVIVDRNTNRVASLPFIMDVVTAALNGNDSSIYNDRTLYQQYNASMQGALANEANNRINADNLEKATRQSAVNTLQNNIDAEATARQTADNTLQGNINSEASARASADSNLQSQINQIIAPSGEAPSAAEVVNARIGADGRVYGTLGDAIRTQNSDLKSAFTHYIDYDNLFIKANATDGKRLSADGEAIDATPCFVSEFIKIKKGFGYYLNFRALDVYHRVSFYSSASQEDELRTIDSTRYFYNSDAEYIRFCSYITEKDEIKLLLVSALDTVVRDHFSSEMEAVVTPEMFGAYGDGTHDDSVALQNAINTGKTVFGYGSYKTTQTIRIGYVNQTQKVYINKITNAEDGVTAVIITQSINFEFNEIRSEGYGINIIDELNMAHVKGFLISSKNPCINVTRTEERRSFVQYSTFEITHMVSRSINAALYVSLQVDGDYMWFNSNRFYNTQFTCYQGYGIALINERTNYSIDENLFVGCSVEESRHGIRMVKATNNHVFGMRCSEIGHEDTEEIMGIVASFGAECKNNQLFIDLCKLKRISVDDEYFTIDNLGNNNNVYGQLLNDDGFTVCDAVSIGQEIERPLLYHKVSNLRDKIINAGANSLNYSSGASELNRTSSADYIAFDSAGTTGRYLNFAADICQYLDKIQVLCNDGDSFSTPIIIKRDGVTKLTITKPCTLVIRNAKFYAM